MSNWQHGLFGCFDNCTVCIITYFVPCYTQGKVAESVGESCLLCGLSMFVPLLNLYALCTIRQKVRETKNIDGSMLGDILATWCCTCCALAQEAQETGAMGMALDDQQIERA